LKTRLLKLLKRLGLGLSVILVLVASAAGAVLFNPALVLNDRNLRILTHLLEKSGVHIEWETIAVEVRNHAFFDRTLSLRLSNVCVVDTRSHEWSGCFESAAIAARIRFNWKSLKLIEAGPITLTGGRISADLDRLLAPSSEPGKGGSKFLKKFLNLDRLKIDPLELEIRRYSLILGGDPYAGELELSGMPRGEAGLEGDIHLTVQSKAVKGNAQLRLTNERGLTSWGSWFIHGNVAGSIPAGGEFKAMIAANPAIARTLGLDFHVEGNYDQKPLKVLADLSGKVREAGITAELDGRLLGIDPSIRQIEVKNCALSLLHQDSGGKIGLACPVAVSLPALPRELRFLNMPSAAGVVVRADVTSSDFFPAAGSQLAGSIDVSLNRMASEFFSIDASVRGQVDGVIRDFFETSFPGKGKATADVAFRFEVPRFEHLVQSLDKTEWAVPAPARVLRGDTLIDAKGQTDFKKASLPLQLTTSLQSPTQKLQLSADSEVKFQRFEKTSELQAVVDLVLKGVQIQMPRLDIGLPPSFVPEARIYSFEKQREAEKAKKPSSLKLHYLAHVKTPDQSPVKILTNLAQAPVPINVDVAFGSDQPLEGTINVDEFPIELFHQKATVQYFNVTLADPTGGSKIDGRVEIPTVDYTVLTTFVGTIDKPVVKLTSEPSLPDNQIIAMLIFGQTPDTLDLDQSSSVGSTQQAISGGALNLGSLYLLASTPVQSVGYDPTTGEVTARVKIAEGTSVVVGESSREGYQSKSVGIRKRLGKNWSISSEVANEVDPTTGANQQTKVTTLLQWSHRY
jgi:hypothetical protein